MKSTEVQTSPMLASGAQLLPCGLQCLNEWGNPYFERLHFNTVYCSNVLAVTVITNHSHKIHYTAKINRKETTTVNVHTLVHLIKFSELSQKKRDCHAKILEHEHFQVSNKNATLSQSIQQLKKCVQLVQK